MGRMFPRFSAVLCGVCLIMVATLIAPLAGHRYRLSKTKRLENLRIMKLTSNCQQLCADCRSCQCHNETVDCTKTGRTQMPNVSVRTKTLVMSFNKLVRLNATTFRAMTQLQTLKINFNRISYIELGTFEHMDSLVELALRGNYLSQIEDFLFSPLTNLQVVDLSKTNVLFNPRAFINASSVSIFNFNFNGAREFPSFTCRSLPIFPRLRQLSLSHNGISEISSDQMKGLESLQHLGLGSNQIYTLNRNHFHNLPALELLNLDRNVLSSIQSDSFCHATLRHLDLSNSKLSLKSLAFVNDQSHAFKCVRNLRYLILNGISVDRQYSKFQNLSALKVLHLRRNGLSKLPTDIFLGTNSIEQLNIGNNPLSSGLHALSHVKTSLKDLYAAGCHFTEIPEAFLPRSLWKTLSTIDLSGNLFACTCQLVWFVRWLKTTNVTILPLSSTAYRCATPIELKYTPLLNLTRDFERLCFLPPPDYFLDAVIILLVVAILFSTLGSLLHRFRWHVRYWHFVYKVKNREYMELVNQREYEYDAFVIYSHADSQWVIHELRPQLETKEPKLRLCIHHRDWLGGRDITDNIVESIEASRKSLLVVSNAFAASSWCQLELTLAQTRLFEEDRDNLVLVLLEEIAEVNVTPRLRLQMTRQTYVEWPPAGCSEVGRQLFWAQLRQALSRPASSLANTPVSAQLFAGHIRD